MRKSKLLHLGFILAALNQGFAESDWYTRKLEGWYYFQEGDSLEMDAPYCPEDAMALLEDEKLKLQEALSLALLAPTKENINHYIVESQRHLNRSAEFANAWGKALSTNNLEALSKTHFLLFCFRGQDPESREAAKIANLFAEKNHWTLKAVSLDGVGTEGLAAFECDQGITKALDIRSTPSFYAVDPVENKIILIGTNSLTVADLEQNIEMQFGANNE
jgi:hypothetical protein